MSLGVTIGFKSGVPHVLAGPDIPVDQQINDLRKAAQSGRSDYDRVEVWTDTRGMEKRVRFNRPVNPALAPAPEPAPEPVADTTPEPVPEVPAQPELADEGPVLDTPRGNRRR
jgi:hypothetical protein